ncbi:hypothetical protein CHS0354_029165 [Potamilus streckersoni]|uniref:Uncharacterized protein n=1 Tax=Potamilus streckersoni TaxID=2493646 RepID=A0AAE0W4V6_9BIVA|nr:hypothetical protein CHS0354_029165 [Potamilus streckersoni]
MSRRTKKVDQLRANQKIFEDKVFAYGSLKSSPQELLCKWCRKFVGFGDSFCSIACHAKFTRTCRRRFITLREVPNNIQINREVTKTLRSNTPLTAYSGLATKTRTELQLNTTAPKDQSKDPFVCEYHTRQLIYPGSRFCDQACETRKCQLINKIVGRSVSVHFSLSHVKFQCNSKNVFKYLPTSLIKFSQNAVHFMKDWQY